jgi:hypothetical protein
MGRFGNVILRARCPLCGLVVGVKHIEWLFRKARLKRGVFLTEQTSGGRAKLTKAIPFLRLQNPRAKTSLVNLGLVGSLDALIESFVALAELLSSAGLIPRAVYGELRARASAEGMYDNLGALVDAGAVREESTTVAPQSFRPQRVDFSSVSFDSILSSKFKRAKVSFEEV